MVGWWHVAAQGSGAWWWCRVVNGGGGGAGSLHAGRLYVYSWLTPPELEDTDEGPWCETEVPGLKEGFDSHKSVCLYWEHSNCSVFWQ